MTREEAEKEIRDNFTEVWADGIIKALEQQSEDAISRAQAQTEIEMHACRYTLAKERDCIGKVEWDRNLIDVADAVDIIRNLPPLTPQEPMIGNWIPVNERLPEESGEYLVYVIDEYGGSYEAVGVAWFAHKKDYDIKESEWRELGIDEAVIAWMPLPKPYKPESKDKK